jgi:tetratricopeptide (TPR) repeat protein
MAYCGKGLSYFDYDLLKAIQNLQIASSLNHGSELPLILENLALAYGYAGILAKAKDATSNAFKLTNDSIRNLIYLANYEAIQSNYGTLRSIWKNYMQKIPTT